MAKKSKTVAPSPIPAAPVFNFPNIAPKSDLECRVLLEDQILFVDVGVSTHSSINVILNEF